MVAIASNRTQDTLAAYEQCRQVARRAARTFYWGSQFLPAPKRRAAWALYALCRAVDDIADHPSPQLDPRVALNGWRLRLTRAYDGVASDAITRAWVDLLQQFAVPLQPALDLIAGVEMDLDHAQPQTFDDLRLYSYRVAGTVGLLMAPILGYRTPAALPLAVDLGIAMQLTNILRDIGEDARNGRIYLPRDEMAAFGYADDDLRAGRITPAFVALMRFQIARAQAYYERARPGIDLLDANVRLAILASAEWYRGILGVIIANGYDVFTRRARVPFAARLRVMPRLWLDLQHGAPLAPLPPCADAAAGQHANA